VAARSRKAFMMRLQPRTGLAGTLLATSLADGAAFILASKGSSSPDAEANIAKTAARLARLHTRPKTAPATRALKELSLNFQRQVTMVRPTNQWLFSVGEVRAANVNCGSAPGSI
jgi:hypothetical protein